MSTSPQKTDLSQTQTVQLKDYEPASNNKRVIAFILDGIFVGVLQSILFTLIRVQSVNSSIALNVVFWFAIVAFYWTYLTYRYGGSPGKLILRIRVVNQDRSAKLSISRLLLRETIGRLASTLPIMLGYLWVSWDKERRTFHDMIAKTRVIAFKK